MKSENKKNVTRRDFLQFGVSLTAGIALPPLLSSCGGGNDGGSASTGPAQTFVQPQVLQSVNGQLDVSLSVSYLDTAIGTANPAVTQNVSLRASFSSPTHASIFSLQNLRLLALPQCREG